MSKGVTQMSKVKQKLQIIDDMANSIKPVAVEAVQKSKVEKMSTPVLRWLCVKEGSFFKRAEYILEHMADDGNWYEVPEVSLV